MTPPRARRVQAARWGALAALGGGALFVWATFAGDDGRGALPAPPRDARSPSALPAATPTKPAAAQPRAAAADPAHPAETTAAADEVDEGERVQPHPISDERLALLPPWETVVAVKAALAARDFERARSILAQRRNTDARRDEFVDFYLGLEIMTDCMESPGATSRARAEAFIVEHRSSPLRRHVRRKCIAQVAAAND